VYAGDRVKALCNRLVSAVGRKTMVSGCGRWEVAANRENFIMFSISLDIAAEDMGRG